MTQAYSLDEIIDLTSAANVVTVDSEGMERMLGYSLCFDGLADGLYFPLTHIGPGNATNAQAQKMYNVLQTREHLVFHNAFHDLRVFARNGYPLNNPFYDTMLMQHWINEELTDYSLNSISKMYGFEGKQMPELMGWIIETEGWDHVPVSLMTSYSGTDAFITHGTFRKIEPQFFAEFTPELWEVEQEFIRLVMIPMKDLGIKIDPIFCINEYEKGTKIMEECKEELKMNPGSPKQLKNLLIDELGLPVVKHTNSCKECRFKNKPVESHDGPPSFDKHAMEEYDFLLERMGDKRAQTILRYRGWQKSTSASYKAFLEKNINGIIYPNYNLHRTRTSRLSSSDPNLQQIPKSSEKEWNGDTKKAFVPRDGYNLWTVDFSQLQFRMTVAYAKQWDLIEIFNDDSRDIFQEMANAAKQEILKKRDNTKTMVYLILFGGGGKRAMQAFSLPKLATGRNLVNAFHEKYPGIRKVSNEAQNTAEKLGYVKFWTGRRRHFFKGTPTYRAFNAVIQGGEAEIMKRCMIALAKEVVDENCHMVLQIHDEIAFEIRDGMEDHYLPRIKEVMERTPKDFCKYVGTDVAFKVSAKPWGDK